MKDRATVLCIRDGRVLLVARARSRWALPGGRIRRQFRSPRMHITNADTMVCRSSQPDCEGCSITDHCTTLLRLRADPNVGGVANLRAVINISQYRAKDNGFKWTLAHKYNLQI
jgi:hypothetical protein